MLRSGLRLNYFVSVSRAHCSGILGDALYEANVAIFMFRLSNGTVGVLLLGCWVVGLPLAFTPVYCFGHRVYSLYCAL